MTKKEKIYPNGIMLVLPAVVICFIWAAVVALFVAGIFSETIKNSYGILIIIVVITVPLMTIILLFRSFYRVTFDREGMTYAYWFWSLEKISYAKVRFDRVKGLRGVKRNIIIEYQDGAEEEVNLDFFSRKQINFIMQKLILCKNLKEDKA